MDNFKKGDILGKGSFGTVYQAVNIVDGKKLVLKEIILVGLTDKEIDKRHKEAKLLSTLKHPHIIQYLDHRISDEVLTIAMEYAVNGTLKDFIQSRDELLEHNMVVAMFSQLLLAVEYLHSMNIIHRDICNRNILLTFNNQVKLCDFGVSKHEESWSTANSLCGHPGNLAPELCHGGRHSEASDMWALGCILYELCTLEQPFKAPTIAGLLLSILESSTPRLPSQYSHSLMQLLVASLLSHQSDSRPTAKSLLVHPMLTVYIHTLPVTFHQFQPSLTDSDMELLTYFCPDINEHVKNK